MRTIWELWMILVAPLWFGFRMADDAGGGAAQPAAGGDSAAAPNPLERPANEPHGGAMTMGGRSYTAEEVHAMTQAQGTGAASGTDGAKPKDGVGGTDGAKDPAKVTGGTMIPRERYNETVARKDAMLRAAGIDPETGAPIAKAAEVVDAGKPKEFAKGQEPWAKDLVALPRSDDKNADGTDKYPDTASFLEALADAKATNKVVEALGKRAVADQAAADQRAKTQQTERDNQAIHKFTTEAIPSALVKRGLLKENPLPQEIGPAFDAAMEPLTKLPPMERQSTYLYNFATKNAKNGADLLLAVAEEAKTPEGVAHILKLGSLSDNDLISELIAMDRLVSLGLTIQGKPRAQANSAGKPLTNGGGTGNGGNIQPSPGVNGSGRVADTSTLSGAALFQHLEAETKARNEAVMKRFQKG